MRIASLFAEFILRTGRARPFAVYPEQRERAQDESERVRMTLDGPPLGGQRSYRVPVPLPELEPPLPELQVTLNSAFSERMLPEANCSQPR